MKLSMRQNDLKEDLKTNDAYFKYDTNTDEGSSGAPVFNDEWQWIGVHRYGDKELKFNSAVKASSIWSKIKDELPK